jgi:glycosyltransferase involved in cell wall biosynthesis
MKTSIAMATFNGAEYLQEQLESFLAQTRLPDELIVCDDGSEDDTLAILHAFQKTAPFHVEISENQTRLGCTKNFEKAASLCTGDLIFFSDQDDVWFENKLEVMIQFMENHPQVMVAVNDAEIVDEKLTTPGIRKSRQVLDLGLPITSFHSGCCLVFRDGIKSLFFPVPDEVFAHDTWLNRLAGALESRTFVDVPLQYYRRHTQNTSDWIASSTTKKRRLDLMAEKKTADVRYCCSRRIKAVSALKKRLHESDSPLLKTPDAQDNVQRTMARCNREIQAARTRLKLLDKPRLLRIKGAFAMLVSGVYKEHFSGWQSFLKDLVRK